MGTLTTYGEAPLAPSKVWRVGAEAGLGREPEYGEISSAFKISEQRVVYALKSKTWPQSGFEKDQNAGQLMFGVRNSGAKPQELAMATLPQVNSLLRAVHEKSRSMDRQRNFDTLDAREQAEELIYRLNEGRDGALNLFLLGVKTGRINADTRRRALEYFSPEGILGLWNYLGVYQNSDEPRYDGDTHKQTPGVVNLAVQGPLLMENIFQPLDTSALGTEPVLGAPLRQGDHCSVVLRRRRSAASGEYEEFCFEPVGTQRRYVDVEDLEYEDYDGSLEYGVQTYVGQVIDAGIGSAPDSMVVARMRGIGTTWKDAHAAHRDCDFRVKLALAPLSGDYANA